MKFIFKLHGWLGLFNGIWLLILGITGSLLVYYHDLDRYINKDQLTVQALSNPLPIDSIVNIAKKKMPNARGANIIHFPTSLNDSYGIRIYIQDGTKDMIHWWETYNIDINPYTGAILREGYYRDFSKSFIHWVFNLHWSLHLGPVGNLIIAIVGIILFINIITGIIVYRKYLLKVFLFRAPIKWHNWRTIGSGLHRYIGVWTLVFNILIFYSGLQMNWNAFYAKTWIKPIEVKQAKEPYFSIKDLSNKVQEIYPGFKTHYLYIPFVKRRVGKNADETISFRGWIPGTPNIVPESASKIEFDPYDGSLVNKSNINEKLAKMNLWDKFNEIVYSFHVGSFAGSLSRILYVFVGLTPAILSITGFLLWWRRKKL